MNTSPTRVVMNALIIAFLAESLPYQKPMSKYEHSPMISQPMKSRSRLSETTRTSIPKANSEMNAKKRGYIGSPPPAVGGIARLAVVVIADAVDEGRQAGPGDEEKRDGAEGIHDDAEAERLASD